MKSLPVILGTAFIAAGLAACEQVPDNKETELLVPRNLQVLEQLPAETVYARVARLYPDKRLKSFADCADYHQKLRQTHNNKPDYDTARCYAPNSGATIHLERDTAMIPMTLNATLK